MKHSLVVFAVSAMILAAGLVGGACGDGAGDDVSAPERGLALVRIGALEVEAEVPRGNEFYRGLGGRDSLPDDRGMIFVFSQAGDHGFWMRGMLIPIDIIWISDENRVIDVQTAIQPEPGVPDDQLPIYRPDADALYVLEVRAGLAAEKGVQEGDEARIELP